MKVGDLVSYYDCDDLAIVLYVNEEGSTVKVLLFSGEIRSAKTFLGLYLFSPARSAPLLSEVD